MEVGKKRKNEKYSGELKKSRELKKVERGWDKLINGSSETPMDFLIKSTVNGRKAKCHHHLVMNNVWMMWIKLGQFGTGKGNVVIGDTFSDVISYPELFHGNPRANNGFVVISLVIFPSPLLGNCVLSSWY